MRGLAFRARQGAATALIWLLLVKAALVCGALVGSAARHLVAQ